MRVETNPETGQAVADEIEGGLTHYIMGSRPVAEMVRIVLGEHARMDVLVNNAGTARHLPTEETSDENRRSTYR